jgi:hypothetical protein
MASTSTSAVNPLTPPPTRQSERARRAREHAVGLKHQLSWRLPEFAAIVGISLPTLWRRIRAGDVRVVRLGGVVLVPRSEAVRLGLCDS